MIFAAGVSQIFSVGVACADGWPDARIGLGPIAQRIAHEDCRLLIIGDSNSVKVNNARMLGGMFRMWNPDHFVGRASPGVPSSNEGIKVYSNTAGLNFHARRMFDPATGESDLWSNGQRAFVPNRAWELVSNGSGLSGNAGYCIAELTRLDEYPGGDWTVNASIRTRLIYAHDQSGFDHLRYRARRGTQTGSFVDFQPWAPEVRPAIDWVDTSVPSGSGTILTEVRTPSGWTSSSQGGPAPCPENCTEGMTLFHVTQLIWRDDVSGLQIDSIAEGGMTVTDHLSGQQLYDNDALRGYLAATRQPNCFMILLGQNMRPDEQDIEGVWRTRLEAVMARYRQLALDLDSGADPLFLLVSPWSTNDTSARFGRISDVLADIATTRPDTGFINLHLLAGSARHLNADGILGDGVHFGSDAGADFIASLLWEQIERELTNKSDVVIDMDGTSIVEAKITNGVHLHLTPDIHEGPLRIDAQEVMVRGWDGLICGIAAPSNNTAVQSMPESSLILERLQLYGGDGILESSGHRAGGAIHAVQADVSIDGVSVTGNTVDFGGCIAVRNGSLNIIDSILHDGHASQMGGLVDAVQSELQLTDTQLLAGIADHGGGLSAQLCDVLLERVLIQDCTAYGSGGARLQYSWGVLDDCDVLSNTATIDAGGVTIDQSDDIVIQASWICDNVPIECAGEWVDGGGNQIGGCACPGDLDGNGMVDVQDLLLVLEYYGDEDGGDTDGNGLTDVNDLLIVVAAFGPCP